MTNTIKIIECRNIEERLIAEMEEDEAERQEAWARELMQTLREAEDAG